MFVLVITQIAHLVDIIDQKQLVLIKMDFVKNKGFAVKLKMDNLIHLLANLFVNVFKKNFAPSAKNVLLIVKAHVMILQMFAIKIMVFVARCRSKMVMSFAFVIIAHKISVIITQLQKAAKENV